MFEKSKRQKLKEDYEANKLANVEVLIDNVWDAHNVAAIMRSADGFGISCINLYYTYNKFPNLKKSGKKSSATANKWMRINRVKDLNSFVKEKKREGFVFIALDISVESKELGKFEFPSKCILILGSEKEGISSEVRAICDEVVSIPMVGMVQSYNVSVSGAVAFYEIFRQHGGGLKRIVKKDRKNLHFP